MLNPPWSIVLQPVARLTARELIVHPEGKGLSAGPWTIASGNGVASKLIWNPPSFSAKPTVETPVSSFNVSLENRKGHSVRKLMVSIIYSYLTIYTCG